MLHFTDGLNGQMTMKILTKLPKFHSFDISGYLPPEREAVEAKSYSLNVSGYRGFVDDEVTIPTNKSTSFPGRRLPTIMVKVPKTQNGVNDFVCILF